MAQPTNDPAALAAFADRLDPAILAALTGLLGALARPHADVVQAAAFELVDDRGRVRARLANLASGDNPYTPGLALHTAAGDSQAAVQVEDDGANLVFMLGGNLALQCGVANPGGDQLNPGPYLLLMHRDGSPALDLRVNDDGLTIDTARQPPPRTTT